ncbi:unnamed protein product [Clonostachys solani]|uniref:Amino acid transporter transmembrane domain-containing protein n=1 Tax=Clonostachys solani TaxID=160281 RepID=A0A9N9ZB57_9HYPO|nr:unnamed protein product [Clonostachys solani]
MSVKMDKTVQDGPDVDKIEEGEAKFHRLGWKRLAVILIVEAVALGSLSLPAAYATLGMVCGVILTVGLGFAAIYASYVIGEVKLKYPEVRHYTDIGRLLLGEFGYWVLTVGFVVSLILVTGSHCLTGKIAFASVTGSDVCTLVFSIVSAIILLALAIPPSFAEIAILGYVDFASIAAAILITMIATGIQSTGQQEELASAAWSAWPRKDITFTKAMTAVANIVFAYAFAVAQPSFMDELHTPQDFKKSVMAVGVIEIGIYTLTGSIIYYFVGQDVKSPALLSAGPLISRVAFGVAFPVIFVSGSINITVLCRYLHGQMYRSTVTQYVNTVKGWTTWLTLVSVVSILAWIIAEAIPFFNELLSIISSLFVSGFSYYLPPLMWFALIKEGPWYARHNLLTALGNFIVLVIGLIALGCGTYASVIEIINKFQAGLGKPFSCSTS